jgi:hypothetical protein
MARAVAVRSPRRACRGERRGIALLAQFLGDQAPDHHPVPHTVLAVVSRAQLAAAGGDAGPARSRARTVDGRWVVLHGTQLGDGPEARTAVIIEPARPAELAELIVLAYGLTARERAVTRPVLQGRSTAEIAGALHLSPSRTTSRPSSTRWAFGAGASWWPPCSATTTGRG